MADESTPEVANGQVLPVPAVAQPSAAMHSIPAPVGINSEQLKQRLDETRDKTRSDLLKEFGFQSVSEGKKAFEMLRKLQEAQLSDAEKQAKQLEEYRLQATRYEAHSKRFASMVDAEIGRLPESAQKALLETAGDDPDERYKLLQFMSKAGVGQGSAQASAQSVAAQTVAAKTTAVQSASPVIPPPRPANAGALPPAPRGATPLSKYDEYVERQKTNQVAADLFYSAHQIEIERTRPASQ